MRCYHCGQEIDNDSMNCIYCGASQGAGATVVLDQAFNPYAANAESGRTDQLGQAPVQHNQGYVQPSAPVYTPIQPSVARRPALQLPTGRGLAKMVFLGLITFGIYDVVIWCKLVTELNIVASRYDGKRTMPYFAMLTLVPITFGILPIVWTHKLCNRIGAELQRRGCNYEFDASTYWLWGVLGSLILVGPFIYLHKLMKAMNLLNASYNEVG